MTKKKVLSLLALLICGVLIACSGGGASSTVVETSGCAGGAVSFDIIFAPESLQYLPRVMDDFNRAYREGRHPVTGAALANSDPRYCITGRDGSSGTVMQGIVNAIIAPSNSNVARPVIFQPSVSHWLALANFQSGRTLFDLTDVRATALAPVVMAIWESRLQAIRAKVGYDEIGWEELLQVLNAPNGWCDYDIPNCRRAVYYGHTDPLISSTALSTLIAEFYAAARADGFTGRRLTLTEVRDPDVQNGVRRIESLIRHYSTRTTEFKEYIAQGPDYLDFVALEENDLIYINQGKTQYQPPEKLVALYPKEGTFWHEHPMGIVNADWTTQQQRDGARVFIDYVLTPDVQRYIMSEGFRPANPDVALDFPIVQENGVDPTRPRTVLDVPAPDVIAAIQQSWALVKKQADVMLLIDISGSMSNEGKMEQAIQAALAFLEGLESNTRIGLTIFSDNVIERIPLTNYETVIEALRSNVRSLRASGGTELYKAVRDTVNALTADATDADRIRAVVLLSDGADTGDEGVTLFQATAALEASRTTTNPVILIPVAYGSDADIQALGALARASATRVASGDPQNIRAVLEIISSYF